MELSGAQDSRVREAEEQRCSLSQADAEGVSKLRKLRKLRGRQLQGPHPLRSGSKEVFDYEGTVRSIEESSPKAACDSATRPGMSEVCFLTPTPEFSCRSKNFQRRAGSAHPLAEAIPAGGERTARSSGHRKRFGNCSRLWAQRRDALRDTWSSCCTMMKCHTR